MIGGPSCWGPSGDTAVEKEGGEVSGGDGQSDRRGEGGRGDGKEGGRAGFISAGVLQAEEYEDGTDSNMAHMSVRSNMLSLPSFWGKVCMQLAVTEGQQTSHLRCPPSAPPPSKQHPVCNVSREW